MMIATLRLLIATAAVLWTVAASLPVYALSSSESSAPVVLTSGLAEWALPILGADESELLRPLRPLVSKRLAPSGSAAFRAVAQMDPPPLGAFSRTEATVEKWFLGWAPLGAGVRAPPVSAA